ncbi:ylbC [Symbiodinium natans]|uniref:YlbC protein n=1 Tax=Symbiodinium natans TaxID=878477 RepID=A0A812VC21_9DINO|nr:ylbC [Symbiodinium natans]
MSASFQTGVMFSRAAAIGRYVPGSPAGNVQQHRRPSGLDFCGSPAVTSFEPVCTSGTSECVEDEVGRQIVPEAPTPEHDENLDGLLAALLGLPDDELKACVSTLRSILSRIAEQPNEPKFRRLRKQNPRFHAEVGRHEEARALMRHAGFCEEATDGSEGEIYLVFKGDLTEPFKQVHEAVREAASIVAPEVLEHPTPEPRSAPPARCAQSDHSRRQHIAALTEQRLKDPRGFREDAVRRRKANHGVGGAALRPPPAAPATQVARRSQHFTLTDIENLRTQEAIAGMPSYADEYQRTYQGSPATSYSTLVSRSYDPELIARQALDGTNRYRASKGMMPLQWHDGIARIAREHARQMASGAMPFSHDGVDQRFRAYPVAHRAAAENLALNNGVADVAKVAVDGWIKSPGHEKNLRGTFNLCGIGVARASNGTFYLTQLFALQM